MNIIQPPNLIHRYGPPNKMDHLPKGTTIKVENVDMVKPEYYEQTSDDVENPVWVLREN